MNMKTQTEAKTTTKMGTKRDSLGFILAVVTGVALLAILVVHAFFPHAILPTPDGMAVILVSLVALAIDAYVPAEHKHDFRLVPVYGAIIFGVFPLAAFVAAPMDALRLALLGAVILTVLTFLFDSILDRLSGGPVAKAAPLISAFGLYLAAQALMNVI